MTLIHGGNVYQRASEAGCSPEDILDFSASINPLGPPPGLRELLARTFNRLQHYPDIRNRGLIDALSTFHSLPAECAAAGNGSTELIYWLPRALGIGSALAVMPTFSEYAKAFEIQGLKVQKLVCGPESGFQPGVEQLDRAVAESRPEAVLLTHPGSPAGSLLSGEICEWVSEMSRGGRFVIVDEVFVDFCEKASFKKRLEKSPNLVIIRSLTKFYGLPGLRIGYLLAGPETVGRVRRFIPPWSVNTLAQAAGAFCLDQDEYRLATLDLVESERRKLMEDLSGIPGLRVFPGNANFLLIGLDRRLRPAGELGRELFDSGRILIRNCGSFEGLDEWYFRVAVRLPEQNRKLVSAIRSWMENYSSPLSP